MRDFGIGDTVVVQQYNTAGPRKIKTGEPFTGTIQDIHKDPPLKNEWQRAHREWCMRRFLIYRTIGAPVWVWRYEIKRRIKGG